MAARLCCDRKFMQLYCCPRSRTWEKRETRIYETVCHPSSSWSKRNQHVLRRAPGKGQRCFNCLLQFNYFGFAQRQKISLEKKSIFAPSNSFILDVRLFGFKFVRVGRKELVLFVYCWLNFIIASRLGRVGQFIKAGKVNYALTISNLAHLHFW